ncbi:MAG: TetR/AcrR family transcriptional regulator [Alphaproteobacteria bacterium]|nr:TetR/AcrR family transcriptional regulator [Alphaproteobacteria bacterium]
MNEVQPRRGAETRERLLEIAEHAVLAKGFAATSIDELIAAVGITKSGFFYHFKSKEALAKALLQRYIDNENELLDSLFGRADELHEDPLHGFLVGLKMFAEMMADLPNGHPGCLVASYCYQENLFSRDVHALNKEAVLAWRGRFRKRFELIAERYPPRLDVDLDALADMISVLVDGGIIVSKVVHEKNVLPQQIMLFRDYVRAIFLGT